MAIVRKRKANRSRGAAAAETALVLPILLMLTFGTIKYGWLFMRAQQITNAARNGARMASLLNVEDTDVKTSIIAMLANANITVTAGEIVITPVVNLDRPAVNVQITIPSASVDILDISWLPKPENISASVTMAREG